MKDSADPGGWYPATGADNTDLQISSYPTKAEFNHFLSFIQNDSNFKDKLKRAYLGRC